MTQIFAYVPFKNGKAEDVALEFPEAGKKIDADAAVTAIVTGSGADLDSVATEMTKIYGEVIKVDNEALAYPNAEVVRKALVNIIPGDAIVLVAHDTFGMDIAPGLSVKMDAAYAADIINFQGLDGTTLKMIRQELGGAVSTHVTADISAGAVITVRPGAFAPADGGSAGGTITDKSADAKIAEATSEALYSSSLKIGLGIINLCYF